VEEERRAREELLSQERDDLTERLGSCKSSIKQCVRTASTLAKTVKDAPSNKVVWVVF
jgi:hypothetical protein